jgi:AAHS family benzoate transporter-like MFS transporter
MLLGALSAGLLAERLGARRLVLIGVTWFSVAMIACAAAPGPDALRALRFLAGLGLGGVIPSSIALTMAFAPRERRQFYNALMFAGYPAGGVLAAALARWLLADHGWRLLFGLGAAPLLLVLPLAWRYLPDHRPETPVRSARLSDGPRALFRPDLLAATLLFGAASFCGLLLVYGLNTWLPQLMRKAGYDLGTALTFLIVLNVGAIVGAVSASVLADRFGAKRAAVGSFAVAVLSLIVLTHRMDQGWLFLAVGCAGFGSVGTQILINGYLAGHYPERIRAAALGWSLGIGRAGAILGPTLGGWLLDAGFGFRSNFYTFAGVAAGGLIAVAFIPRRRADAPSEPSLPLNGAPVREELLA